MHTVESKLFEVPASPGCERNPRQLWIVAGGVRGAAGSAAVLVLRDGAGRVVGSWQREVGSSNLDQATLLAVVEGLKQARERRAGSVTVLCPSPILADRLNRKAPMAWDDPAARLWMRARALSHGFNRCEFRLLDAAAAREVSSLSAVSAEPSLAAAA